MELSKIVHYYTFREQYLYLIIHVVVAVFTRNCNFWIYKWPFSLDTVPVGYSISFFARYCVLWINQCPFSLGIVPAGHGSDRSRYVLYPLGMVMTVFARHRFPW